MPIFTQPIHEHGDPDRPGPYPHGAGRAARAITEPQIVRPGQSFDLVAAAQAGASGGRRLTRRFLFDPASRELVLGWASGVAGPGQTHRDQSHAEALSMADEAEGRPPDGKRYDKFVVHGHIQADTVKMLPEGGSVSGPLAIVIDRVVTADTNWDATPSPVETSDQLAIFARRLSSMGATRDTPILAPPHVRTLLQAPSGWTTLGKAFPDVFPQTRRKRAA